MNWQEVFMKTKNFYLKLTLLLVVTAMMTACGASKKAADGYDTSSRLTTPDIKSADTSSRPLAYCNQSSNSQLSIGTSTYQDGETITYTKINLKILKIPAYFSQNQNYIEFHKYMVNSTGNKIWGSDRMMFSIYSISDEKQLVSGRKFLYWADLQAAAQSLGVTTPEQFFKKARLVIDLDDANGDYDAITAFYYNQADDSVVSKLDSLIPVFDADPAKYATERDGSTRHSSLQDLHPFKSYASQGWTSQVYQTKANEFCKPIYTVQ